MISKTDAVGHRKEESAKSFSKCTDKRLWFLTTTVFSDYFNAVPVVKIVQRNDILREKEIIWQAENP